MSAESEAKNFHEFLHEQFKRMTPVTWQVFYDPNLYTHPHIHYYPHKDHYHQQCEKLHPLATISGYDIVVLDMDYESYYEMHDNPYYLVIRASVPLEDIENAVAHYIHEIYLEVPDVTHPDMMTAKGYQMELAKREGVVILRMPNPEHCLMLLERLADKDYFTITRYDFIRYFMQALLQRYNEKTATEPPSQPTMQANETYLAQKIYPQTGEHQLHYYLQPKLRPKGTIKPMQ